MLPSYIADIERRLRRLEMERDQNRNKIVAPDRSVAEAPPLTRAAGAIDHGSLTGLADNDHPQYLLTTGKAVDSDKLDGLDSTGFATAGHNHDGVYIPLTDVAWQDYTPTCAQITIGNGTFTGRYMVLGKMAFVNYVLTIGSTTTFPSTSDWVINVPKTIVGYLGGTYFAWNYGFNYWSGIPKHVNGWSFRCVISGGATNVNYERPFTWNATDVLSVSLFYETT